MHIKLGYIQKCCLIIQSVTETKFMSVNEQNLAFDTK